MKKLPIYFFKKSYQSKMLHKFLDVELTITIKLKRFALKKILVNIFSKIKLKNFKKI